MFLTSAALFLYMDTIDPQEKFFVSPMWPFLNSHSLPLSNDDKTKQPKERNKHEKEEIFLEPPAFLFCEVLQYNRWALFFCPVNPHGI
ncbi:unnamed protein product [Cylicostephanus goldi]|uniref:Uncharacterized protein n=1 Tax=Cylicostephanus goldi TaxID=71465 RepID=A0A3P7QLS7_CYLGO|nr:unnamed protein product [Cylicostephanus goldi]